MLNLKYHLNIIFLTFFVFTISSCTKEHDHILSPSDVTITISSPIELEEFDKGDTVRIIAKISAPSELHGYEVHVTRLADNTVIINKDVDLHGSSFDINESFINEGLMHSDMELEIVAVIGHDGTKASKTVHFHCHDM